jgi:hypothetical protein
MRLRDRLSKLLGFSQQCLPFIRDGGYTGDSNGVVSIETLLTPSKLH